MFAQMIAQIFEMKNKSAKKKRIKAMDPTSRELDKIERPCQRRPRVFETMIMTTVMATTMMDHH